MRTLTTLVLMLPLLLSGSACGNAGEGQYHELKAKIRSTDGSGRGYIGVGIQDLRPAQAREMKLTVKTGALVNEVVDDSPAAAAGIMENDVIVEFNKVAIDDAADLTQTVRKTEPGTKTTVSVIRKDQKKALQITVGSLPAPHTLAVTPEPVIPPIHMNIFTRNSANGLSLMELNPQLAEYFGAPAGKGVLVEEVQKRSAAKEAGIKAGDVILRMGEEEIANVEDVSGALEGMKDGDSVTVSVLRRGAPMTLRMEVDGMPASGFYFHQGMKNVPHVSPDMKVFQLDRMHMQHDLQRLQEELRSVGRDIRGKVEKLRNTVRKEVRSAMS